MNYFYKEETAFLKQIKNRYLQLLTGFLIQTLLAFNIHNSTPNNYDNLLK